MIIFQNIQRVQVVVNAWVSDDVLETLRLGMFRDIYALFQLSVEYQLIQTKQIESNNY